MESVIDFTNCKRLPLLSYNGGNGNKIGIEYNGEAYMLKFPPLNDSHLSYTNGSISEYISCHIFQMIGLNAQDTILGIYKLNDKTKIVCACKDFTMNKLEKVCELKDFASIKNGVLNESSSNGYGKELKEIIDTINEQDLLPSQELLEYFWNMFIIDCLLGNFDRHNGNWGFLINYKTNEIKYSPIFDCGSCLYPQLSDDLIDKYLHNEDEIKKRVYIFPNSAIRINDKKINYFDFVNSLENNDCNNALLRMFPKINLKNINEFLDDVPLISDTRKEFYKLIIEKRYNLILKNAYGKLQK